jgi:hypothetical protein
LAVVVRLKLSASMCAASASFPTGKVYTSIGLCRRLISPPQADFVLRFAPHDRLFGAFALG